MTEMLPTPPEDAAEAAYRRALLDDEAGRDARRARLMAALPRPAPAPALPVSRSELAWRWQPHGLLGLLALGLLVGALLAWRGRPVAPQVDPRLVSAERASGPTVVAEAGPPAPVLATPPPVVPAARAAARAAAKSAPVKPRAVAPPPAAPEPARVLAQSVPAPAAPSASTAEEPRPAAASVMAAAAPPHEVVASAAVPAAPTLADAAAASAAAGPAEGTARAEAALRMGVARSHMLAPSAARAASSVTPSTALMLAVGRADLVAARAALQMGASVHQRDALGRTPLMLAARTGSRDMVRFLLAAGARQDDRDPRGWSAADHARDAGHEALADSLH